MSDDHIRAITIKRTSKKKSGYTVRESSGSYFVANTPARARVNKGDQVVTINGINAEDFIDEEDANDLIESIRIVVIPEDELEEYDAKKEVEDNAMEGGDRRARGKPGSQRGKKAKGSNALALVPAKKRGGGDVHHCNHCGHDNDGLSVDEDGDLVCEKCGAIIPAEQGGVYRCENCDHENVNPSRDEDGDLVCEECGEILPEKHVFRCQSCHHENINPVRDEDGDLCCEQCGEVLPEPEIRKCERCGHETRDPQPDEDGDIVCEECGEVFPSAQPEYKGRGQSKAEKLNALNADPDAIPNQKNQFDADGRPLTGTDGKRLTPAEMFSPGDVITVTVGKSNPRQDAGLKVEERNGKYYVRKVPTGGLFSRTPVMATDKILELNGRDSHDFKNVNEMKKLIKDESRITIVVLRKDPDASESSASSVDYDNLQPVGPDGEVIEDNGRPGSRGGDAESLVYDGHDCGCLWCPMCS